MPNKDGGPAFPHEYKFSDGTANRDDGMTLRDWFAGMALQGYIAARIEVGEQTLTNLCYAKADAMIEERGRDGNK